MKNTKLLLRVLALCLALVCTFSLVAATTDSGDRNEDGVVNVWDLQMVKNGTDAEKTSVLSALLGGADELHPNGDGVYEIHSPLGLYNMANMIKAGTEANKTFKLMNDIDMQGAAWQTTDFFDGIFEGDGKVISNVNVHGEIKMSETNYAVGFFGKVGREGAVRNLKLENVTNILTTESKANFIGLLTGSITGEVKNCTTVGTVIDPRTTLTTTTYVGTLAGRVENTPSNPVVGITVDDESILMTAESAEVNAISGKSQKVLCKMGMDFGALETGSSSRKLGIAGWAPDYTNFKDYTWQDISGACTVEGGTGKTYELVDPILTARRQAVVDKMYEICTIPWTPSQNMTLYYYKVVAGIEEEKLNYYTRSWKAGTTYYGMPYNHGSGSLERFKGYMDDVNGLLTVKESVPAQAYYYTYTPIRNAMSAYTDTTLQTPLTYTDTNNKNTVYDLLPGFKLADQPMQVGEVVNASDHAGFSRYIGNDCSQAIAWAWREVVSSDVANGGTVISGVTQMAPTKTYQTRHGVLPVGNLVPTAYNVPAWDALYTAAGKNDFMNAYAQASRGDGLIVEQTEGGHSRMIAYDPICIHRYETTEDGKIIDVIDPTNSYLITHEQGGTKKPNVNTTCHWDRVLTFEELTSDSTHGTGKDGSNCKHYMPMTLPAFHDVDNKAVTSTVTYKGGVVKSNFVIVSTEVDGKEVFTAIGQHNNITPDNTYVGEGYREAHIQEDMVKTHGDLTGKTIRVNLSNGDIYEINADTGVVTVVQKTTMQ